jgi:hypothetical protein
MNLPLCFDIHLKIEQSQPHTCNETATFSQRKVPRHDLENISAGYHFKHKPFFVSFLFGPMEKVILLPHPWVKTHRHAAGSTYIAIPQVLLLPFSQ